MDYEKERIVSECDRAAQDRPFRGHDARLAAGAQARATLGGSTRTLSPLEDIADRVRRLESFAERIATNVAEVGHKLRSHADLVSGELPQTDCAANQVQPQILDPSPLFGGAMGEVHATLQSLESQLHRMDDALSYCAFQAGRNTTLA